MAAGQRSKQNPDMSVESQKARRSAVRSAMLMSKISAPVLACVCELASHFFSFFGHQRDMTSARASPFNPAEAAILSFVRSFVEGKSWWSLYGTILGAVQLITVISLTLPSRAEVVRAAADSTTSTTSSPSSCPDGLLTVLAVGRGCALANAVAFWSFRRQLPGLIGSNGLTPAKNIIADAKRELLARSCQQKTWNQWFHNCFLPFPTVFGMIGSSDRALLGVCTTGFILSIFLFISPILMPSKSAMWATTSTIIDTGAWWTCGLLYLSLIHVSGDFLGLQSDSNLVEIDALLGLVRLVQTTHPYPALLALRFFAFRKMLGCGICKWYGSDMWQKLTAMNVHYFTQPLPNRWSYFAHHMPQWFHRQSVLATFVIEILLPYLVWADLLWTPSFLRLRPLLSGIRYVAWIGFNSLNFAINISGNYGFIGFLNTMENLSLTDDRLWIALRAPFGLGSKEGVQQDLLQSKMSPLVSTLFLMAGSLFRAGVATVIIMYLNVSSLPTLSRASRGAVDADNFVDAVPLEQYPEAEAAFRNAIFQVKRLYKKQRNLRLCNYQGKFAGMHDYRWEPIIEGSRDGEEWYQYKWKYKLNTGPDEFGRVLPFHLPRLDWRVWFLPLTARRGGQPPGWYYDLLDKLQKQQPEVVSLLEEDPFAPGGSAGGPVGPPGYIRSRLVEFTFAPKGSNSWWQNRELRGKSTPLDIVVVGENIGSKKND